jgi:hypothetical protein
VTPCHDECLDDLPLLLVLGLNVKPLALPLPPPNTWSQQLSTSVLERLPDIAVIHLINLLLEPVLALVVPDDVPFLLVDELLLSLLLVPLLSSLPPFFTANAKITKPLLDAVTKDIAVMIARTASVVVITFFVCIELAI